MQYINNGTNGMCGYSAEVYSIPFSCEPKSAKKKINSLNFETVDK